MDADPRVSVIIVNYNGLKFLDKCLTSVTEQNYPGMEIILVDNGSTDGSVDFVTSKFPSVRVLENKTNLGFAAGNNVGIKAASGELIATLNNDTEVSPDWISSLVRPMSDQNVGMCASKMLRMVEPGLIDSAGIEIARSGACWDRGMFEPDDGRYSEEDEVFGPCAGAALYRKRMLDEIGIFDEKFFAYMEDVDLAFRGRLAGWKCIYVPGAIVRHYHGGTAGYETDFNVYYGNRNIVWMVVKNYPARLLLTSLPWILGRNIAVVPYYIVKGHGFTIIRSKIDAILGLPAIVSMRARQKVNNMNIARFIHTHAHMPRSPKNADKQGYITTLHLL